MAACLDECVIALTGKFEDTHGEQLFRGHIPNTNFEVAIIATSINANGGRHSTKVTDGITHLVATSTDVEKNTAKG